MELQNKIIMKINKILKDLGFEKQSNKEVSKNDTWFIKTVEMDINSYESRKYQLNVVIKEVKSKYKNKGIYMNIYLENIFANRELYLGFVNNEEFLKQLFENIKHWK